MDPTSFSTHGKQNFHIEQESKLNEENDSFDKLMGCINISCEKFYRVSPGRENVKITQLFNRFQKLKKSLNQKQQSQITMGLVKINRLKPIKSSKSLFKKLLDIIGLGSKRNTIWKLHDKMIKKNIIPRAIHFQLKEPVETKKILENFINVIKLEVHKDKNEGKDTELILRKTSFLQACRLLTLDPQNINPPLYKDKLQEIILFLEETDNKELITESKQNNFLEQAKKYLEDHPYSNEGKS